jgi:MFS family permease
MIVSGITPSVLGDAADQVGRRPIYIFAFVVYFAANIGLALQDSYPALLVLRMVQSVGSSGAVHFLKPWLYGSI